MRTGAPQVSDAGVVEIGDIVAPGVVEAERRAVREPREIRPVRYCAVCPLRRRVGGEIVAAIVRE